MLINGEQLLSWLRQRQKHYEDFSPKKGKAMAEVQLEVERMMREADEQRQRNMFDEEGEIV